MTSPVLLMGDSVADRISLWDTDRRTLWQMVRDNLEGTAPVHAVRGSSYHAGIFAKKLSAERGLGAQYSLLVFPINMRSFSPQWRASPFRTPSDMAQEVSYPHSTFTTVGQFMALIKQRHLEGEAQAFRLNQIFVFHYGHPLDPNHERLAQLADLLRTARAMSLPVLDYLTPLNRAAILEHAGPEVDAILQTNRRTVTEFLRREGLDAHTFLDLMGLVGRAGFFGKDEATEHLNEAGRRAVAGKLADAARDLLSRKEAPPS